MSVYHINMTDKCNLNCKFCYALKTNISMNKQTLDNTIDFIIHEIITKNFDKNENIVINFMGGEVGLSDPKLIQYAIDKINEQQQIYQIPNKILYDVNTNLVFELTDDWIELFKKINLIGISWDYKLRFHNLKQEMLWINNVKKLQSLGFNNIKCLVTMTKDFIENCSPDMFMSFMLASGISVWEFNKLTLPVNGDKKDYEKFHISNRITEDWMYQMFLKYEYLKSIGNQIIIETFDCIIDSVKGDYYYVHSRTCQNDNRTISPNGDVAQCVFTSAKPFYNVNTKRLCYTNYDNILKIQDTLKDDCKNCSLLKYCKGDCCLVLWDETGCATPKKIYEHILKGKKNV